MLTKDTFMSPFKVSMLNAKISYDSLQNNPRCDRHKSFEENVTAAFPRKMHPKKHHRYF